MHARALMGILVCWLVVAGQGVFGAAPKPRAILGNDRGGRSHASTVTTLAFSPDGRMLASGSQDKTIKLWSMVTGKEIANFTGKAVQSLAFTEDGKTAAVGGGGKLGFMRNGVSTWERIETWTDSAVSPRVFRIEGEQFTVAALSPDGRSLAAGALDRSIKLWDRVTGKLISSLRLPVPGWVSALVYSPDGKTLLASLSNLAGGQVVLWDVPTRKVKARLPYPFVSTATFSRDGRILVLASIRLTVYDLATKKERGVLDVGFPRDAAMSIALSPDGQLLASGSENGTIKLWDTVTGKEKATLTAHTYGVSALAFSPDGRTLASGSWDKTVKLWEVVLLLSAAK